MQEHFDFRSLKKVGVFSAVKFNDYEEQAKRVCEHLGLKSIYDYHKILWGVRCHLSVTNDPNGFRPFITTFGMLKSTDEAKVIDIKREKEGKKI